MKITSKVDVMQCKYALFKCSGFVFSPSFVSEAAHHVFLCEVIFAHSLVHTHLINPEGK